jgi:hypothetical protein
MPTALKSHRPVRTRSPFFINCVPTASTNITSASLSVKINRGNRASGGTAIKTYTLSKTNAVDGIIVFDIAPLVSDYIEHQIPDEIKEISYDITSTLNLNANNDGSEFTTIVDTTTMCNLKVGDKFTIKTPTFTSTGLGSPCNGVQYDVSVWYVTVVSFNATSITFAIPTLQQNKAYCLAFEAALSASYAAKVRSDKYASQDEILFIEVDKTVVDTGTTTVTEEYYTANYGYSGFKDGVNFLPSTGATGNYGTPTWSPTVAKQTDVTIMATDCYRQMGTDSYAILPIFTGEFDHNTPDVETFARIKWGAGTQIGATNEAWLTYVDDDYVTIQNIYDVEILPSDFAIDEVEYSVVYIPLGKKNLCSNFVSGKDFLRVGHFLNRNAAGSPSPTTQGVSVEITSQADFSIGGGFLDITVANDASVGQTVNIITPTFTDGGVTYQSIDEELDVDANTTSSVLVLDISTLSAAQVTALQQLKITQEQMPQGFYILADDVPRISGQNTIAKINDQSPLRYEIICEPKYNVVDCLFINKFGFWDSFSFIKKSMTQMSTTESKFKRNIGEVVNSAYTYDTNSAQHKRYNVNGSKSIIVNTGFVDESFSLLLEEIMLSESIVLIIDDVYTPVTIQTNQVEFKKSVNDKLINYTLTFDFAYNELNDVI